MPQGPYSFLTLQKLAGAAVRLSEKGAEPSSPADWLPMLENARDRLASRPFSPHPMFAFDIKQKEKTRQLIRLHPSDHLIHLAMLSLLSEALAVHWPACVHGFLRGRSTYTAAAALVKALQVGLRFLLKTDVADFFPSINLVLLEKKLGFFLIPGMTELIMDLIKAPILVNDKVVTASGLPMGSPLSPMLANLYLMDVDRAMEALPVTYLRYGDDLAVAAPDEKVLCQAEETLRAKLLAEGLQINEEKTLKIACCQNPFVYLGHTLDETGIYQKIPQSRLDRISREKELSSSQEESLCLNIFEQPLSSTKRAKLTLYVSKSAVYLKISEGMVVVQQGKEVLREVPLRRIERVLILEGVSFSSGFVSACISNQIPVLVFVGKGRAFGTIVAGSMPNPLRLRAQYDLHANQGFRISIAKDILLAKLRAFEIRLKHLPSGHAIFNHLARASLGILSADSRDSLMGIEGDTTKAYYRQFARRISVREFAFITRSKRPPKDPINSLLSFIYSLIFGEMQTALLACGLDPHPGFLHALHRNHPALASDLVEPFRPLVADSFVLFLVNGRQVKAQDFETHSRGAVYMSRSTRNKVLEAYEKYMSSPCSKESKVSWRDLIHATARAMLAVVLGEASSLEIPLAAAQAQSCQDEVVMVSSTSTSEDTSQKGSCKAF